MRGVAGIHIEDQGFPKKCGHLDDKEVVSREDYIAKIRAAVAAKRDGDFLIIARTDARAVAGLDEAVTRANAVWVMPFDEDDKVSKAGIFVQLPSAGLKGNTHIAFADLNNVVSKDVTTFNEMLRRRNIGTVIVR